MSENVDDFTPYTEHGRALLDWPENFGYHHPDCEGTAEDNCTCDLADHIIAIEAEAVQSWLNSPSPAALMADANLPEAEIIRALAALRGEAKP